MNDIFNMIKANIERNQQNKSKGTNHVNADRFLRGSEEQRYLQRKAANEQVKPDNLDELDEELGENTKEKKNYSSNVEILKIQEISKLPPDKQNRLLIKGYIELYDAFMSIQSDLKELDDELGNKNLELHSTKRDNSQLKDLIRHIAAILPDGARLKERLDTSLWQVSDVEEDFITKISHLSNRVLSMDEYIEKQTESVTNENKSLKRQLVKFEAELTKIENLLYSGELQRVSKEDIPAGVPGQIEEVEQPVETKQITKKPVVEEKKQPSSKPTPAPAAKKEERPRPPRRPSFSEPEPEEVVPVVADDDDDDIVVVEVDRYVETLSEAHKDAIKAIGETGVSRNAELKPYLEEKYKSQEISQTVKSLREGGFLDAEQVKLGSRGGYNFTVYELSKLGKAIYKNLSGQKAVVSEKKLIQNQHKSLEHGFLIKESAILFEEMGYKVYQERQDLRFDLPDGKRKDFDLIIEKGDEKCHIEVERGTHVDEDFFNAMDKIYQVMENLGENPAQFYFIAPNEQILYGKTKRQFFMWINKRKGGMENVKGKIVAHFAKFESIKKKGKSIWETIKF